MGWIGAELLKYKRTFTAKLIIFIPAFFAVYAIATGMIINSNPTAAASGYTGTSWLSFLAMIYNWWPVLFLPLGMGIFAGLADSQERKAGRYRALCSHDISPFKIWVNKVAGMAVISFLSTVILIIIVIATGLFAAEGTMPLGKILAAGLLCWFTSLALIPFQLWTAAAGGILISIGVGFLGSTIGVLLAPTDFWFLCPWSHAARLMCPVVGVHPNGVLLDSGSALLNTVVIPLGIAASALFLAVLTTATGIWFGRREL